MNISSVQAGMHSAAGSGENPRLESAAHEFEASLMQELLKPLQEDPLFDSGDGNGSTDILHGSSGSLMGFGSEALAEAISERGGFGIATKILTHFRTHQESGVAVSSGKL